MSQDSAMLHNRAMIVNNLAMLVKNKCNVSVSLGGKETLLTVLISINHQDSKIVLDYGSSEYLNKKLVNMKNPHFNTVFNGIQVSFHVDHVSKSKYKGSDCFIIDIPHQLYWYNRREYYRVDCPTLDGAYIEIRLNQPNDDAKLEKKEAYGLAIAKIEQKLLVDIQTQIADEKIAWQRAYSKMGPTSKLNATIARQKFEEELEVHPAHPSSKLANVISFNLVNVSMSGCQLINIDPEFSYYLPVCAFHRERLLHLPHVNIEVSFKVVTINSMVGSVLDPNPNANEFEDHIGIEFLDLHESTEGAILRYVQDIERQSGLLDSL
jgi:c-di-GMP-binding flagellar brake protein YcgR